MQTFYAILTISLFFAWFLPDLFLMLRRWLQNRVPTIYDPTYYVRSNAPQTFQRPREPEELNWWQRTWYYGETLNQIYKVSEKLAEFTFSLDNDTSPSYPGGIEGCVVIFIPFLLFFAGFLRLLSLPFVLFMFPFFILEFFLNMYAQYKRKRLKK